MKTNNSNMKCREDLDLAVFQFNDWVGKAVIYWFPEDDIVETYVYASSNEWDEFRVPVVQLYFKSDLESRFESITVEDANKLLNYYKEKWSCGQREFDLDDYEKSVISMYKNI